MILDNEIILRPRFIMELKHSNQEVLQAFETAKTTQNEFIISRVDDHVFIRLPKHKQQFWSPQLHLEINEIDTSSSKLHGLFGPNPTVWTLFMFSHFIVALIFTCFAIWAYSNWALENNYTLQIAGCISMIVLWFVLYFIGRAGRYKGKKDMQRLHNFMLTTLHLK
ncbi:GTP-binding protein [Formosa sp. S-31]|uniref:GTP-binding protein n=1 Tax=Formosa sp. S-31 TaxID=2790949 RepID=UPI003EB8575D